MDKFGLSINTIESIKKLFSKNKKIEKVIIFGSRAKNTYKKSSDIDFAVVGNLTSTELNHISFCLDELSTPYKFDVINYNTLSDKKFKENVDNEGQIFFEQTE